MYKHLFGPVPSRRLGMSLGVDLVPLKVCSLDCIYCEVGQTTELTVERKEYVLYEEIIKEIDHFFMNNPDPDYITFSGSGEPTLNLQIGEILNYIKQKKPNIPLAILTNGTLLYDKGVIEAVCKADIVLPSLDAVTDDVFKRINRPDKSLSVARHKQGLIDLRKVYSGKIWLEVFILPSYNDSEEELIAFKKNIIEIQADKVQLNSLDRPGVVNDLRGATTEELQRIIDFWGLVNVEIIASPSKRNEIKLYRNDVESSILETISRRPCTLDDISKMLGLHISEINKYLGVLETHNKIEKTQQTRGLFYRIKK